MTAVVWAVHLNVCFCSSYTQCTPTHNTLYINDTLCKKDKRGWGNGAWAEHIWLHAVISHMKWYGFLQQKESFKKRWFILDSQNRKLLYFKGQLVRTNPFLILTTCCNDVSEALWPPVVIVNLFPPLWTQDAEELGVIFMGTESNGYSVRECVPKHARGNSWNCGLMVVTPERQFVFMCEQEREQKEWLSALRQVMSKPMAPQDYTSKYCENVPWETW